MAYDYEGETSASHSHVYAFDENDTFSGPAQVVALDRATNDATATFTVTHDAADPTLSLSAISEGTDIALDWNASDPSAGSGQAGSGLATCTLQYQMDDGDWQLHSGQCAGSESFDAQPGHTYTFRLTATDHVGNEAQTEAGAFTTAVTKYYYFGSKRVAMRGPDDAVVWLHGDHLGSTSLATDAAQAVLSRQLYYPFGGTRWTSVASLPTDFQFTGQRIQSTIALYDYHARFYDPYVGRFIQADTIVPEPGNPQHFNRYSYVHNNPLRYTDPSGHKDCGPACQDDIYFFDNPPDLTPLWDPHWIECTKDDDRQAAEQAFLHLLYDPMYFANLYADPEAWRTSEEIAALELFARYSILHTRAEDLVLAPFDWDTQAFAMAAQMLSGIGAEEEDVNKAFVFLGLSIAAMGGAGGDTCPQCGTVRPDLVRTTGALRIDPDGASVACATCVDLGQSYMESGQGWRIPWDAAEAEAQATGVGGPEWTGPQPDHFGIFRDGPVDRNTPLWDRLNQFIRSFPKFKWGGDRNR